MSRGRGGNETKTLQVCEGCRMRKVRCDTGEQGCQNCQEAGISCTRRPLVRFKDVSNQKTFAFAPRQTWAVPTAPLSYHDETPEIAAFYHAHGTGSQADASPALALDNGESVPGVSPQVSMSKHLSPTSGEHFHTDANQTGWDALAVAVHRADHEQFSTPSVAHLVTSGAVAGATAPSGQQNDPISWSSSSIQSLSQSEAILLRHYMEHMALWADGPDTSRCFELQASRLALTDPVLRYAICTFSSRHMHRHHSDRDVEALKYQDSCLQLLIPAISEHQPMMSEGILAAVAILRQNEEMDEHDNRFHLEGITQILNEVSAFASSGGLREATAWLCLREDIYVSLTTHTAVRTNLIPFENATWIQSDSDSSWANHMVLLLARLLSVIFLEHATDSAILAELKDRISAWDQTKPHAFTPIHFLPRDPTAGRYLPDIWMLAAPHAVGVQYYHIARLILAVSAQGSTFQPFNQIHEHRATERRVRQHLLYVVGIAKSNPKAQNTWFTAHHCLAVWGGCLRKQGDQWACLDFLEDMEHQTGWRVGRLVGWLKAQWEDDTE